MCNWVHNLTRKSKHCSTGCLKHNWVSLQSSNNKMHAMKMVRIIISQQSMHGSLIILMGEVSSYVYLKYGSLIILMGEVRIATSTWNKVVSSFSWVRCVATSTWNGRCRIVSSTNQKVLLNVHTAFTIFEICRRIVQGNKPIHVNYYCPAIWRGLCANNNKQ